MLRTMPEDGLWVHRFSQAIAAGYTRENTGRDPLSKYPTSKLQIHSDKYVNAILYFKKLLQIK